MVNIVKYKVFICIGIYLVIIMVLFYLLYFVINIVLVVVELCNDDCFKVVFNLFIVFCL